MSKRRKQSRKNLRSYGEKSFVIWLTDNEAYTTLCAGSYTSLDQCPEIVTGCRAIAELISSMTIYLMSNTERGDERIQNALSRKLDIEPCEHMTRRTWMEGIVMDMLLYGRGNSVVIPHTDKGILRELEPVPAENVSFIADGRSYKIIAGGIQKDPENVLHFVYNPDNYYRWKGQGLTVPLKEVANRLRQAGATEKAFMEDKWKPSVIVKVDALTEEFSGMEGRQKLLDEYISTGKAGTPWVIPADAFSVEQVKPLSLADLAINETVNIDKKTVAAIIGVPPFLLGVGEFNDKAWNNFISSKIRPIAQEIEQEMTRKLILNPKWYVRFNTSSLMSYDIQTLEEVYTSLYVRGIVTGNEVRDKLGLSPQRGLDELVILENYIPREKVGDQLKLKQGGDNGK